MPIYEYQCWSCGHEFERREGFDAEPAQPCPLCSGKAKRVIHAVGVLYKGSGFYTTDYKRSSANTPSYTKDGTKDGNGAKPEMPAAEANKAIAEVASKQKAD